ncbi:MAG TPA: hypothetical protein VM243_02255 [Phycisphaerae bacterium]|nr:hypothetical protein [Phycisphaerae bacterium]
MKQRHLTRVTSLLLPLFCCDVLLAQGGGDYNGDSYVDLDDFGYWDACMTGPGGGLPDPDCAAFDFDSDVAVDLVDFGGFMAAFTGPSPCTFGRKYARAWKSGNATGCSARIRTRSAALCGEPSEVSDAGSHAWAGVNKFVGGEPEKWAQIGYGRYRLAGATTVYFRRYAEVQAGPNDTTDYVIFHEDGVPTGVHKYKCFLLSSLFGTWNFEYDDTPFFTWTHSGWKNVTGTDCQWAGEIFNKEDQMLGTAAAKCNFTDCQFSLNWGAFQNANIAEGEVTTDDPNEWGIERIGATAFDIWDINP